MTLEELRAEFPHGSMWHGPSREVLRVVGHRVDDGWPVFEVLTNGAVRSYTYHSYSGERFVRIPDPVPCPITEPTTLHTWGHRSYWFHGTAPPCDLVDPFTLVLHPAEPGATEGRYTWEQP